MKKKILAVAIAGALVSPSAFAAQDTSGMHYTSASEGFYASLRIQYESGRTTDTKAEIRDSSNRIGVRGTNDLGGGLTGFYQWEGTVGTEDGSNVGTRLSHVGLRGGFGEIRVGSFWANSYNWVVGSTDVANWWSGYSTYQDATTGRAARINRTLQYTSPDLNGFQAALSFTFENTQRAAAAATPTSLAVEAREDRNDLDAWQLSAVYNVQGFTAAGTYSQAPDNFQNAAGGDEDLTFWAVRLGYGQDNWYVNGWYGEDNAEDSNTVDNQEFFSVAGGVSVDKVNLYFAYDNQETGAASGRDDDTSTTVGVQYNLGSNSRVWIEYVAQDYDTATNEDDWVNIGMRHDF